MKRALTMLALALALGFAPPEEETARRLEEALRLAIERERAGEWEQALASLDALVPDASELDEHRRAELAYARGVLFAQHAEGPERMAALEPLASARALAGPGELRLDATYDLGLVHLLEGERQRALMPEIAGREGAPPAPVPPVPPGVPPAPGSEPEADPLELARAAYLAARELLVERLRAEWRDEDTRANLELVQRRLRELDEIEREREENEEQEEEQSPDESESGEDGEPQEDPDAEEGEGEEDESEGQEQQQEEEGQEGEGETESDPTSAPPPPEGQGEAQSNATPEELQERHLTREEVMRLLDRLGDLEEEGKALEAMLREAQRVPVERDW